MRANKRPLNPDAAATLIQTSYRGFFYRKYTFTSKDNLPQYNRSSELTFTLGNDPDIKGLEFYMPTQEQPIAILATSGLRVLKLACQIGTEDFSPKIFLIDNSSNVYQFWQEIKKYASQHEDVDLFMEKLPDLLDSLKKSGLTGNETNTEIESAYFEILFERFGFDYVRNSILNMTCVCQSWEDPSVFIKIKKMMQKDDIKNIYVYASNIISFVKDPDVQDRILKNIAYLEPALSIHTDINKEGYPENVFLSQEYSPEKIRQLLFSEENIVADEGNLELESLDQAEESEEEEDESFYASLRTKASTFGYNWLANQPHNSNEAENAPCEHNQRKRGNASSTSPAALKHLRVIS